VGHPHVELLSSKRQQQQEALEAETKGAAVEPTTGVGAEETPSALADKLDEKSAMLRLCSWCSSSGGDSAAFSKSQLRHKGIWLHALRYRGRTWEYASEMPSWALEL